MQENFAKQKQKCLQELEGEVALDSWLLSFDQHAGKGFISKNLISNFLNGNFFSSLGFQPALIVFFVLKERKEKVKKERKKTSEQAKPLRNWGKTSAVGSRGIYFTFIGV